tara:strand:+ start:1339 stop:1452 length:114 start_codon:yes stop_codon:yes gene_type:complete
MPQATSSEDLQKKDAIGIKADAYSQSDSQSIFRKFAR